MTVPLACELFLSVLIIILSIGLVPAYLIVLGLVFLFSCCLKCCFWEKISLWNLYLDSLFFPYTLWLCYIKTPWIRLKYGYTIYYIGTLSRNHFQNLQSLQSNNNNNNNNNSNIHYSSNPHSQYMSIKQLEQQLPYHPYSFNPNNKNNGNSNINKQIIRVVCISDSHTRHKFLTKNIPNGDILIHCGDITFQGNHGNVNTISKDFYKWFRKFDHKYKIIIGGNHDRFLDDEKQWTKEHIRKNIFHYAWYDNINHDYTRGLSDEHELYQAGGLNNNNDDDDDNVDRNDNDAPIINYNINIPNKDHVKEKVIYLENDGIIIEEFDNLSIFGCPWSVYGGASGNHAFQFSIELAESKRKNLKIHVKNDFRKQTFRRNRLTWKNMQQFDKLLINVAESNKNKDEKEKEKDKEKEKQKEKDNIVMNDRKVDILIGHSDMTTLFRRYNRLYGNVYDKQKQKKKKKQGVHSDPKVMGHIGKEIIEKILCDWKPPIHLCGHFHNQYQAYISDEFNMLVANCSVLDGKYVPTLRNSPMVFDLVL